MIREHVVRLVAGTLVLVGLVLGVTVSQWWLLLTAFVGLNLFQSSLSKWCLLEDILKKVGVKSEADKVREELGGQ